MASRGIGIGDGRGREINLARPPKFDDTRPLDKDDLAYRLGIRQHEASVGNKRLIELVKNSSAKAPAFVVDRDGAQRMANSLPFFVREMGLSQARDSGAWIVAVDTGSDSTNFLPASAMKAIKDAAAEGLEVPRRRWNHNAYRAEG